MLTEDYIMRMINQVLAVLVKIMAFKQAGRHQEANQAIDQALEQVLGMRADLIKRLDDSSLIEALTIQENLDTDRLQLVAELFKEEGDILAAQGHPNERDASYMRALNLHLEVMLGGGPNHLPEPHEKIEELLQNLEDRELPIEMRYSLFLYHNQVGNYRAADQILVELISIPDLKHDLLPEAVEFYEGLVEKTTDELAEAGFTREHLLNRMDDLTHK
jgi:hypothetical protein